MYFQVTLWILIISSLCILYQNLVFDIFIPAQREKNLNLFYNFHRWFHYWPRLASVVDIKKMGFPVVHHMSHNTEPFVPKRQKMKWIKEIFAQWCGSLIRKVVFPTKDIFFSRFQFRHHPSALNQNFIQIIFFKNQLLGLEYIL